MAEINLLVRASNGVSHSEAPNKQAAITIKKRKPNRNRGFEKTETENRTDWKKTDQKTENRNRPKKPKPTQH